MHACSNNCWVSFILFPSYLFSDNHSLVFPYQLVHTLFILLTIDLFYAIIKKDVLICAPTYKFGSRKLNEDLSTVILMIAT